MSSYYDWKNDVYRRDRKVRRTRAPGPGGGGGGPLPPGPQPGDNPALPPQGNMSAVIFYADEPPPPGLNSATAPNVNTSDPAPATTLDWVVTNPTRELFVDWGDPNALASQTRDYGFNLQVLQQQNFVFSPTEPQAQGNFRLENINVSDTTQNGELNILLTCVIRENVDGGWVAKNQIRYFIGYFGSPNAPGEPTLPPIPQAPGDFTQQIIDELTDAIEELTPQPAEDPTTGIQLDVQLNQTILGTVPEPYPPDNFTAILKTWIFRVRAAPIPYGSLRNSTTGFAGTESLQLNVRAQPDGFPEQSPFYTVEGADLSDPVPNEFGSYFITVKTIAADTWGFFCEAVINNPYENAGADIREQFFETYLPSDTPTGVPDDSVLQVQIGPVQPKTGTLDSSIAPDAQDMIKIDGTEPDVLLFELDLNVIQDQNNQIGWNLSPNFDPAAYPAVEMVYRQTGSFPQGFNSFVQPYGTSTNVNGTRATYQTGYKYNALPDNLAELPAFYDNTITIEWWNGDNRNEDPTVGPIDLIKRVNIRFRVNVLQNLLPLIKGSVKDQGDLNQAVVTPPVSQYDLGPLSSFEKFYQAITYEALKPPSGGEISDVAIGGTWQGLDFKRLKLFGGDGGGDKTQITLPYWRQTSNNFGPVLFIKEPQSWGSTPTGAFVVSKNVKIVFEDGSNQNYTWVWKGGGTQRWQVGPGTSSGLQNDFWTNRAKPGLNILNFEVEHPGITTGTDEGSVIIDGCYTELPNTVYTQYFDAKSLFYRTPDGGFYSQEAELVGPWNTSTSNRYVGFRLLKQYIVHDTITLLWTGGIRVRHPDYTTTNDPDQILVLQDGVGYGRRNTTYSEVKIPLTILKDTGDAWEWEMAKASGSAMSIGGVRAIMYKPN